MIGDAAPGRVTLVPLSDLDCQLIDRALGTLSSDHNDVPHDDIDALRERVRAVSSTAPQVRADTMG